MPVTFGNPPLNEVVVATYFNPSLSTLRNEHVGLFWNAIRDDFPVARQQPPVVFPPEFIGLPPPVVNDEIFPMPRYWFIADDEINLLQIQKNAFMFNWRRRDKEYPRFHMNIKPAFDKYYGRFNEFLRTEIRGAEPTVDLCELSYINAVNRCEFWEGPQSTANVIPSFSVPTPDSGFAASSAFDCTFVYRIGSDLQLTVGIRSGVVPQQQNTPVLIFEIKASGRLGQIAKPGTDEWFERAHDAILKCFLDLTSPEIRSDFWEQTGEPG